MKQIELLAPARDANIGIAAIDCGADAVYIAGPQFGARQAAGNEIEDIKRLCDYAHKFGARIFVTLNTILYDSELEAAYRQMLAVQEAGADAVIVQDMAIVHMAAHGIGDFRSEFRLPLHASTQCATRTPEQAVFLETLGFSRLILERELSLDQIRAIRQAVSCELEFFVHGALCVCYSGQCYLSEKIAGRSANRGACIQACRSLYDLVDGNGKTLVRNKALLSLKDYNLRGRIEELAEAGITSFKIEGRLKNESYVRNVVRDYSMALDEVIARKPSFVRGSFGKVTGGFQPDTMKTFNRGYTELFIDGRRGQWASMDAAKSMGEEVGTVSSIGRDGISLRLTGRDVVLNNGDGFSFVAKDGSVCGFRGDVCEGNRIRCKSVPSLFVGARLYRNINASFEKEIERNRCVREIRAQISIRFEKAGEIWSLVAACRTEDGRSVEQIIEAGNQDASNMERMLGMLETQLSKTAGIFRFSVSEINCSGGLPFMSASAVNSVRRSIADALEGMPCGKRDLLVRKIEKGLPAIGTTSKEISYKFNVSNRISHGVYTDAGAAAVEKAYELSHTAGAELMRTKYCIRYELRMCPVHHKVKDSGPLFLLNNGQRFALHFDCRNCEMTLTEAPVNTPRPQR